MKATKNVTIITESGTELQVKVIAERDYRSENYTTSLDGDVCEGTRMMPVENTKVLITVNGQTYNGIAAILPMHLQAKYGAYAVFASKIGLSQTKYNELETVIREACEEAEKDENWIKYQEMKISSEKAEAEYQAHVKKINNMMTLNGKSY